MGHLGAHGAFVRLARFAALGAAGLALANCSGGTGRIDPKYGVASSERVVPLGKRAPKGGGVYKTGKPYTVAGRTYVPTTNARNYRAVGYASWYGAKFHGRYTANGEIFDQESISAASPVLPLPSYVRVTNLANKRSIVVRVNDRGPFAKNRILDVSRKTAKLLGFHELGVTKVRVEYVGRAPLKGSSDRALVATLRHHRPGEARPVRVAANTSFERTYFDARSLRGGVLPPSRPYGVGAGRHQVVARTTPAPSQARTTQLAAAAKPQVTARATPRVSPVSAYAPVRYDGRAAGFISGRGLY